VSTFRVESAGPLTTLQDRGRVGLAHLGVPRAGALDRPAADLANRLVGNDQDAAVLEVTMGGLVATVSEAAWVAVTGAGTSHPAVRRIEGGERFEVAAPPVGVRSYVAVAGGFAVEPVLGSRSTDTLAWVGPPPVADGDLLVIGPGAAPAPMDVPRQPRPGPLRIHPGPHEDYFADGALEALCAATYVVGPASNRVGLRLAGAAVVRRPGRELPSEAMVLGAVQVPPDGQPVVLLADHPPTGGYPVVGVVDPADLWQCAQLRPGERVELVPVRRVA
jgi:biotin-dependent carboxylase-like uncharacterized protein